MTVFGTTMLRCLERNGDGMFERIRSDFVSYFKCIRLGKVTQWASKLAIQVITCVSRSISEAADKKIHPTYVSKNAQNI